VDVKERSRSPLAAWRYTAENTIASDVLAILRMDAFRGADQKILHHSVFLVRYSIFPVNLEHGTRNLEHGSVYRVRPVEQ
jgi:hypothetical protein